MTEQQMLQVMKRYVDHHNRTHTTASSLFGSSKNKHMISRIFYLSENWMDIEIVDGRTATESFRIAYSRVPSTERLNGL
ncbi:hypothetical protein NVP2275O_176 [Vibrio phage 2.275.O._10N.286.54.E11]|nr:hypothetical protein NVP2275O_176 [Vibrio phage 2.275.O._10N.286.54.E11]